jgi:hypothetical protein
MEKTNLDAFASPQRKSSPNLTLACAELRTSPGLA